MTLHVGFGALLGSVWFPEGKGLRAGDISQIVRLRAEVQMDGRIGTLQTKTKQNTLECVPERPPLVGEDSAILLLIEGDKCSA
jgi:hypothetical protein